ncbi:MAG: hypothetical protein ACRDKE_12905 [Solirubrobacterales bacterium]
MTRSNEIRGDAQVALLAAYAILAFAAVGRSTYELIFKFDDAPVPYSFSVAAAVIYLAAVWAIWRGDELGVKVGKVACTIELIGVLAIGTITTLGDSSFDVGTVWSFYGLDYGWLPLVVPALALWWLYKQHPEQAPPRI